MIARRNYTRPVLLLLAAALILCGMLGFGFSYLPYTLLKARADALVPDGSANRFTPELFAKIRVAFRFMGLALVLCGALALFTRGRIERFVYELADSARSLWREGRDGLRETWRTESRRHLFALLVIFLIAVLLRLYFISAPMRGDEGGTFLHYASRPLPIALSDYSTPNNHLFNTLLVHISYKLFGDEPWAIRLPALLAGILLVPATYVTARTLYNRDAALLSAALVASSSVLVEYSTNARGYSLVCLFTLLALALSAYLLRRENLSAWVLWALVAALGFYSIPVMLYPFGIITTWMFLSISVQTGGRERRGRIKSLAIFSMLTVLLTGVFYFPALAVSGLKAITSNEYVKPLPVASFVRFFPSSLPSVWQQWMRDTPLLIQLLLALGFCASLFFHRRLTRYRVPLILAVILWLTPLLLVQRVIPFIRVWLFLLPLYFIMAAAGVAYCLGPLTAKAGRAREALILLTALVLCAWPSLNVARSQSAANSEDSLGDAEAITVFLKDRLQPGDRVLATADSLGSLHYYFYRHDLPFTYLNADPNASRRILVVLKEPEQSIEKSPMVGAEGQQVVASDYGTPRLVRRFNFASLYEMVR